MHMLLPSNCRPIRVLVEHFCRIAGGSQFNGVSYVKTYHKVHGFCKLAKNRGL
jgi:hypothetical protein